MSFPWTTRRDLQQQIDHLRREVSTLNRELSDKAVQLKMAEAGHAQALKSQTESSAKVEALLQRQIDYWQRTAEGAIDRFATKEGGIPLFHLPPSAPDEPVPEDGEDEGEERPFRGGNPRRFLQTTTIRNITRANQAEVQRDMERRKIAASVAQTKKAEVAAQFEEIDRETVAKAVESAV